MRVLHLIPRISGGGAERQLSYMAREMAKAGHEVHVAYLYEGPEEVLLPDVVTHRIIVSSNYDPMLLGKLRRLIRAVKPDIIQSWIQMMDIAAGLVLFTGKAAWILREPTSEHAYQGFNLKQALRARLARRASAIICNSPGGKSYWLGQGFPDKGLLVIPNAVPVDFINSIAPMQNESYSHRVLIYAGRLMPLKNIDVLIKAMAEPRCPRDVILYVAGDGPAKSYLMSLVDKLKLREAVRFLGFLPSRDLWAHMKSADAFISLSRHEGMPNCVCEAIACGIPLVLSDIPAHRFFLDDNSALLVSADSATAVAEGIWQALNNAQEAKQRTSRALQAIAHLTTETVAARYIELYEKLNGREHAS